MVDTSRWLEDIATVEDNKAVGDTGYRFIDGDTIRNDEGHSIRIDGIDTPETAHERDIYSDDPFRGTFAGEQTTEELSRLAKERGFTEVIDTGKKGAHGRAIGDLRNPETGELYSMFAVREGLAPINPYSSKAHVDAFYEGLGQRTAGRQDADTSLARTRIQDVNFKEMEQRGLDDPFKKDALNEKEYVTDPYNFSGVQIRNPDRTIMNEAKDQWSTSFDTALIGMTEAFHGFRQILGQAMDDQDMVISGEEGAARARYRMRLNPTTTVDLDQVEGVGDFVDYIANNFAMSVPYMATTVASAAVGTVAGAAAGTVSSGPVGTIVGSVVGLGVGISAPTAIYSGQVYNEQENKNVKAALTSGFLQATLDRLGLKGITSAGAGNLKGTLKEAADVLVSQGMTREAAGRLVADAGRKEIVRYMDDAAGFAKRQISARNFTREVSSRFGKAFGSEAVTEAMQEATAYAGANWDDDYYGIIEEGKISEALLERMGKAALAGGLVGGTMGGAAGIKNRAGWANTAAQYHDAKKTSVDRWYAQAVIDGEGSHEEFLNDMVNTGVAASTDTALRIDNHIARQVGKRVLDKTMGLLYSTPRLWIGQMRANFSEETLNRSKHARRIWGMLGGALNKVHSGKTFEEAKHFNNQRYIQMSGNPREMSRGYKGEVNDTKAEEKFSKDFYRISAAKVAHDEAQRSRPAGTPVTAFDWSGYTPDEKAIFRPLFQNLQNTSNEMIMQQNRSWTSGLVGVAPKFKKIDNYLLRFKSPDKMAIEANRPEFVNVLRDVYGMPEKEANELSDAIVDGNLEATGHNDTVFDVLTKGFHPAAAKKRTIGMSEEPRLQKFFHQSVSRNLNESFKSAARFEAYHDYIGKDKWKINQLLAGMRDDGIAEEEIDELAWNLERYFQSESGNYKRPAKGTFGDRLLTAQKSLLTFSLLAALPLSAFSSIVELAMTVRGFTQDQIFSKQYGMNALGNELAKMFIRGGRRVAYESWSGDGRLDQSKVGELLDTLGYHEQSTGAATTTGATEVNERRRWMIDRFFKYNGLQGLTNATRAIRASMANDFLLNHMETLRDAKMRDTEAHRFASEQLRDLGLDIIKLQALVDKESDAISQFGLDYKVNAKPLNLTPAEQKFLEESMQLATFNFVNDAVALPGAANRPLIYQDPRFALLTQFNGYVATITANHLPKMWNEYIKRGSPEMKFSTFSMMFTMIVLGFASQYLKDWLKYGTGDNPYLDSNQKIRRAINSSGLLGSGERVLNMLFPLYGTKEGQSTASWMFDTAVGEMPAMNPVGRLVNASQDAYQGKYTDAKYNILRATPGIGPLTGLSAFLSGKELPN